MEKKVSGGVQQFLTDGYAAYPIHGLPRLDKQNLLTIFDVAPTDWDSWYVSVREVPAALNMEDVDDGEVRAELTGYTFQYNGNTLLPFSTPENGVLFLDQKYLAPLSDSGMEFYLRQDRRGKLYFAIKTGLYLQAVIMPENVISRDFAERMREFVFRCNKELISPSGTTVYMDGGRMPPGKTVEKENPPHSEAG